MSRSVFAGGTDYTHQSFSDIVTDLRGWLENLNEVVSLLKEKIAQLEESRYWQETVTIDTSSFFAYALKFYQTSIEEITDILDAFQKEVEAHHVTRIRHLGEKALELDIKYGKVWHRGDVRKEYGHPDFSILEKIYAEGRNMAADMTDLTNVAERLENFVGRKQNSGNLILREQDIMNLIMKHERRLQKLKEQQASFGLHTPPHIPTEIEDTEKEIQSLKVELENIEAKSSD